MPRAKQPAPRGRPPVDGETRDVTIEIRARRDQRERWRLAAQRDERDLSSWARLVLDREAQR